MKKIKSALISLFNKSALIDLAAELQKYDIRIYATGGTYDCLIDAKFDATSVESITSYPSILGGRVKTLHPSVFGGILARRENNDDLEQLVKYNIPEIDLVIVDLYPFKETLNSGKCHDEVIEKIDIGGISLIRAASKNFKDVVVIPDTVYFSEFMNILKNKNGHTELLDRQRFAGYGFQVSSQYDTEIANYFSKGNTIDKIVEQTSKEVLRYGENPHQYGNYYGKLSDCFEQLNGKPLSYNNILDVDAALSLISEFNDITFAIIKHNNACGVSIGENLLESYTKSLSSDPISAFGGVLVTNQPLDYQTALEINKLFFEIILAPAYEKNVIELLKVKKNRIILQTNNFEFNNRLYKSVLNGILEQGRDSKTETVEDFNLVTEAEPSFEEKLDLVFANKIVKHLKSNAIAIVKNSQLIGIGTGQTSRVDALKQAISKAKSFGFSIKGSVMASDAFFPFADCVQIGYEEGINAIVQPGGSINDKESIKYCNDNKIAMVFTGVRHFKH